MRMLIGAFRDLFRSSAGFRFGATILVVLLILGALSRQRVVHERRRSLYTDAHR